MADAEKVREIRQRYAEMWEELDALRKAGDSHGWDLTKTELDEEAFDLLGRLLAALD